MSLTWRKVLKALVPDSKKRSYLIVASESDIQEIGVIKEAQGSFNFKTSANTILSSGNHTLAITNDTGIWLRCGDSKEFVNLESLCDTLGEVGYSKKRINLEDLRKMKERKDEYS